MFPNKISTVGLALTLSLLAVFLFPSPAFAASYVVNSGADNTTDDAFCTLREAIAAANNASLNANCGPSSAADDTITFSFSGTITLSAQLPNIVAGQGALTINGGGNVIISGDTSFRVFEVNAGAILTLRDINIRLGDIGGTTPHGGAVFNAGTLRIIDSTFEGNSASTADLAIGDPGIAKGGAIYSTGTLEISNSIFSNNTSRGIDSHHGQGGAIYNEAGTLTITDTTFSENSTTVSPGFDGADGGAIWGGGSVTISGSTFSGNTAPGFASSSSVAAGGAIFAAGALTISESTFSDNEAWNGGAIATGPFATSSISLSTFLENWSEREGSAIYNEGQTLKIANSTLLSNFSSFRTSALQNYGGSSIILNSTFSANIGVGISGVSISMGNTIVAGSTGRNCGVGASISDLGSNIQFGGSLSQSCGGLTFAEIDPHLGSPTGSPAYLPLNAGSPAIDAGDNANCAAAPVNNESQNGEPRPADGDGDGTDTCDIGSYESAALEPEFSGSPNAGATLAFSGQAGASPALQIDVTNSGDAGSNLDVALTSISSGYSIVSGLPIDDLETSDPAAAIEVRCDSAPQASGTLLLNTNDPNNASVSYDLTCAALEPEFSGSPNAGATLAFSGQAGASPALQIDVTNSGDAGSNLDVALTSISSGYSIVSGLPIDDLETSDPAAAIEVRCDSAPQASGTLLLNTNDPNNASVSYDLTCAVPSGGSGSGNTGSDEDRESVDLNPIGTTTLSLGRAFLSVPASAIPPGETNCRIILSRQGSSGRFGFSLDDTVWDARIICDSGEVELFFSPLLFCIRPQGGVTVGKQVFHRHEGASSFSPLPFSSGPVGYVCGTTQILSLFTLGQFGLPDTGFAPGLTTKLAAQPASAYLEYEELTLEVPQLDLVMPIWGVPLSQNGWDVSWLGAAAGYLHGSAFPSWVGNSVLTAHVWSAANTPGPFYHLKDLQYGDEFYVHAYGQTFVYEVQRNELLSATDLSIMAESDYSLVTLITCEAFNVETGVYLFRRAVQAVLVRVQ